MTCKLTGMLAMTFCLLLPCHGQNTQVEPNAGSWKTWIISSGRDHGVPPPPNADETKAELAWLRDFSAPTSPEIQQQVAYWDAGAPAYRWLEIINQKAFNGLPLTAFPHRVYAYVNIAMYDATVAAWQAKYTYNRPRPNVLDPSLVTKLPTPNSPSYPSEHAATAAAAAAVLAHFFPAEAASFNAMAEEASRSRMFAGLQYPSDYTAGLALGQRVARQVIARAMSDGSDAVWNGVMPTGPCVWTGVNPGNVTAPGWRPFLLASANEFRPPVPPACDSPSVQAMTAEVRNYPRTFISNYKAFYWQSPEGLNYWPYVDADRWISEDKLDRNPPRVARIYALLAVAFYDAFIASQDGKFAYWYLRPHQLDSRIVPLFPVPNFPSYPSNHSAFSAARSELLVYLFPQRADFVRAVGKEGGDSRIWAGIHYEMDNTEGVKLGRSVVGKFIEWAKADGSR